MCPQCKQRGRQELNGIWAAGPADATIPRLREGNQNQAKSPRVHVTEARPRSAPTSASHPSPRLRPGGASRGAPCHLRPPVEVHPDLSGNFQNLPLRGHRSPPQVTAPHVPVSRLAPALCGGGRVSAAGGPPHPRPPVGSAVWLRHPHPALNFFCRMNPVHL